MGATIHHPKGSMCIKCKYQLDRKCSKLPFSEMKAVQQYSRENDPTVFKVVICTKYDTGATV